MSHTRTGRLLFLKSCFAGIVLAAIATSIASSTASSRATLDLDLSQNDGDRFSQKQDFTIDTRFVENAVRGNLALIKEYGEIDNLSPSQVEVNHKAETGYYGVFTYQDTAYLTTCLRPQGKSIFTAQQLAEAANANMSSRILPWLLGTADLRDWSCLWVKMAVPLQDRTQEAAYRLLQEQWQKHYPQWSEALS